MASGGRRSRSTTTVSTKSSTRPLSRASTTSMQSLNQHDLAPDTNQYQSASAAPLLSVSNQQQQGLYAPLEPALLHVARQLSHQDGLGLSASLDLSQLQNADQVNFQPSQSGQYQHNQTSYAHMHVLDPVNSVHAPLAAAPNGVDADEKKKKGSSASATNYRELKEMLTRNETRSLKEVASEVIATERTSRAEKSKQLFAMLWLKTACKTAKTSVPRNRVYSHYATRCGTERVVPLNHASFGKLVRVIFPGIQTRRLGVRGESKYHYVDLALVDDQQENAGLERTASRSGSNSQIMRQRSMSQHIDFNTMPQLRADTAVFPTQDQAMDTKPDITHNTTSKVQLFCDPVTPGFVSTGNTGMSDMYEHELKFISINQESFHENDPIELPSIRSYLPPKTDEDAANALTALYRTHCTSLIDCIRFCKEKQFFRLFTSFHGTLTVPVQKLLAHPNLAPWIRECDWLMYKKMIQFVSQLTLQVAPPVVLQFLGKISKQLHAHISQVFQGHPHHVLEAKLEPATLFAHLLQRMLRVNSTAHAAAAMLMVDQNRNQMWHDWVALVNPKRIMESELPGCGYAEVYTILTQEIRALLMPTNTPDWLENGTHYQDSAFAPDSAISPQHANETIIDRLAAFLTGLPSRFPQVSPRVLISAIDALGSAALREITVENGISFGSWWVTKVFIDEMIRWLAALGGFLDHQPPMENAISFQSMPLDAPLDNTGFNGDQSNDGSRYSSLGADFTPTTTFASEIQSATLSQNGGQVTKHTAAQSYQGSFSQHGLSAGFDLSIKFDTSRQEQDHEDSGIGLSLIDEFELQKYTATASTAS